MILVQVYVQLGTVLNRAFARWLLSTRILLLYCFINCLYKSTRIHKLDKTNKIEINGPKLFNFKNEALCKTFLVKMSHICMRINRLRAVSLFSWSVEQNARDTQMTTRVTEGARRERHGLPFSFLTSRGFAAERSRARALPLINLKKKRDCSQSRK